MFPANKSFITDNLHTVSDVVTLTGLNAEGWWGWLQACKVLMSTNHCCCTLKKGTYGPSQCPADTVTSSEFIVRLCCNVATTDLQSRNMFNRDCNCYTSIQVYIQSITNKRQQVVVWCYSFHPDLLIFQQIQNPRTYILSVISDFFYKLVNIRESIWYKSSSEQVFTIETITYSSLQCDIQLGLITEQISPITLKFTLYHSSFIIYNRTS